MIPKEFKYNPKAVYYPYHGHHKKNLNLANQTIFVNQKESFKITFPDIFQNYQNPKIHTNEPWKTWIHSSFDWWQCQLNFAVWCASSGCGVYLDFIGDGGSSTPISGLTKSIYIFHVYYCTARILKEIKSPLPTDSSFCYYKNTYDKAAYQKICDEFHISSNTDWRQKIDTAGHGLGFYTQYYKPSGEYRRDHPNGGPFFNSMDTMYHSKNISMAWTTFILDKSEGFTKVGVERINESIRTYVWALLGSQSQTRVNILKVGTGFDAQKQFLVNIQDVIDSPIDLPTQIANYQSVLKYARSKVDYAYGVGLYMSPSDMVLQIGTIVGYNNSIIVADENQTLGFNSEVNATPVAPIQPEPTKGTPTKKSLPEPPSIKEKKPLPKKPLQGDIEHEETKIAIIVGSIAIGIIAYFIYERY